MRKHSYMHLALAVLAAVALAGCASQPATNNNGNAAAKAIQAAQATINNVEPPCTDTGNAASLLQQAREAASNGNYDKAEKLANKANQTARTTLNQCYLKHAKAELAQIRTHDNLTADQIQRREKGQQAIKNKEGRRAYEILSALSAELSSAPTTYDVAYGDTLWGIAGQPDIYANPFEWPLIYKANSNEITDPDLIYPDQEFSIPLNPTADAVDLAIHHAKNRGPWELGEVEQSDLEYLRKASSN